METSPFIEVAWLDAQRASDWCTVDELPKPTLVFTRGWLIREVSGPQGYIILAGSMSQAEVWGECIAIPRGMIVTASLINENMSPLGGQDKK